MKFTEEIEKQIKALLQNEKIKKLTNEVEKATKDIRNINLTELVETRGAKHIEKLEKSYKDLLVRVNKTQKQIDLEISRLKRMLKATSKEASKSFGTVARSVETERKRLQKVVKQTTVKNRAAKKAKATAKKAVTKKKAVKASPVAKKTVKKTVKKATKKATAKK